MEKNHKFIHELVEELKKIAEISFPKECQSCGARYETLEAFLEDTDAIPDAEGLFHKLERDDMSVIDLIRNCHCGSTLMVAFSERRDRTSHGLKRRDLFGGLLERLMSVGVDEADARTALLKVVHGGRSDLLETYGLSSIDHGDEATLKKTTDAEKGGD